MSVEPVQTEFGRKTRIHQSSCNKDYSCVKGFCPSFLTITPNPEPAAAGDAPKKKKKGRIPALERAIPDPVSKVDASFGFGIHVMGIGGTGSVTVVATLANAARLEGKHVIGLDQTGLAQKGGAVISDIKITNAAVRRLEQDLRRPHRPVPRLRHPQRDRSQEPRQVSSRRARSRWCRRRKTPTGQMVSDRHVAFPAISALTARHRPRHAQGRQRVPRRPGAGRGAVRRRDGDQQLHGRRRVPGRHHSAQGRIDRDRDQAVRRRRRDEPCGVPVGPDGGGRSRVRRGGDREGQGRGVRAAADVAGRARDRRFGRRAGRDEAPARSPRARPHRLPGRGLCEALRRRGQARGRRRAEGRARARAASRKRRRAICTS